VKEKSVKIVAIICLSILEGLAIMHGIDGQLFGLVCAIIGGIAGYKFGKKVEES